MGIVDKICFWTYQIKIEMYKKKERKGNANNLRQNRDGTFSHVTYYKIGNAGDTALSQCVRRTFEKYFTVNWNLINVSSEVNDETVKSINRTRALVVGGGGLFLPDTNSNKLSGWQWAVSQEALGNITVPILIFSVGYNYFHNQASSEIFKKNLIMLCKKSKFIGLRNHGSIEAVKKLLPEDLHDKIVYQPCTTTVIRKLYGDLIPRKISNRRIAINIAFDREERRFGDQKEMILTEVAKAARSIHDKGYEIVLVYHVNSDKKFKAYMDKVDVPYQEKDLVNAFPMQIFEFYNEIELVIGMRGHSQMIPFGLNCEIISLVTHDKMRWFLEDIDATDWQIDLLEQHQQNISLEIVEKFTQIHEVDNEFTKKRLHKAQEELWKKTQSNMEEIYNLLAARNEI